MINAVGKKIHQGNGGLEHSEGVILNRVVREGLTDREHLNEGQRSWVSEPQDISGESILGKGSSQKR